MGRSITMDKIRINAFFFLVSFHFLYYIEFYNVPCVGIQMYIMCLFRALFTTCIPLFLLLTGYLMSEKTLSKTYYKKCIRTICIYILASIVSEIYRLAVGGTRFQPVEFIKSLMNFSACPYAWYVEMYLGLFILIPFLNILYRNILAQRWKKGLVVTMVVLTALPSITNMTDFKIIPAWWVNFYPVTYYFIGCYIHEYGLKIKRILGVLLIVTIMFAVGTYSYFHSASEAFVWSGWSEWNSWANVLMGTLVFVLRLNHNTKTEACDNRLLMIGSKLVFGAYLLSWIAEDIVYHHIPLGAFEVENRIVFYPVVIVVVTVSLMLSGVVNGIYDMLFVGLKKELICKYGKNREIDGE